MALLGTFVGAGKFADPNISELIGPARDATALHALFADSLPDSNPTLLVDEAATVQHIRNALRATLDAAKEDDVVIFSFSGHGSHTHHIVAYDTVLTDLLNTSVGMEELAAAFCATKAKAVLCVLDCCFSGGAPAKVIEDTPLPRDSGMGLEALMGEGRILLAASNVDEEAYEAPRTRHGILSKALIDLFLNAQGPVDLLASLGEVMKTVQAEAARLGVKQTPVLLGKITGGLFIPKLTPGKLFYAGFPELQQIQVSSDINDLLNLGFPHSVLRNGRHAIRKVLMTCNWKRSTDTGSRTASHCSSWPPRVPARRSSESLVRPRQSPTVGRRSFYSPTKRWSTRNLSNSRNCTAEGSECG